jgi:hypothetical protein
MDMNLADKLFVDWPCGATSWRGRFFVDWLFDRLDGVGTAHKSVEWHGTLEEHWYLFPFRRVCSNKD